MKSFWLVMLLMLALMARAAERNFLRIDPYKYNPQEVANLSVQVVIDSTMDYVRLGPSDIGSSYWIAITTLSHAEASLMTFIVDLDTGSVAVWFVEYYFSGMDSVVHPDSTHVLFPYWAPLNIAGQWSISVPFLGGKKVRILWQETTGVDSALFQPAYQLMRE